MRENKIVITSVEYGELNLQQLAEKWTELFVHHQHAMQAVEKREMTSAPMQAVEKRNTTSHSAQTKDGGTR